MRICCGFENWRDLRALSGKFLRQKSCYPESFRFLWLWLQLQAELRNAPTSYFRRRSSFQKECVRSASPSRYSTFSLDLRMRCPAISLNSDEMPNDFFNIGCNPRRQACGGSWVGQVSTKRIKVGAFIGSNWNIQVWHWEFAHPEQSIKKCQPDCCKKLHGKDRINVQCIQHEKHDRDWDSKKWKRRKYESLCWGLRGASHVQRSGDGPLDSHW